MGLGGKHGYKSQRGSSFPVSPTLSLPHFIFADSGIFFRKHFRPLPSACGKKENFMKNISSVLCVAVFFLLAIGTKGSLSFGGGGGTQNFTGKGSGSFTVTSVDTNGDGIPGSMGTFKGKFFPLGSSSAQAFVEGKITNVPCTAQSDGRGIVETLAEGSEVYRIDFTGDLIFTTLTSLTVCIPTGPNDSSISLSLEETITGGTGQFANASGSNTVNGTGVLVGPSGTLVGITSTSKGTITR